MVKFKLNTKEKLSSPSSANKPTTLVDAVDAKPKGFGIRSYLHQFYQSPTADDIDGGAWYLLPPPPAARTGLYICRIVSVIGLFLLLIGAATIVIGYTWPRERLEDTMTRIAIEQDEDGSWYLPGDSLDQILKDPMRNCKLTGLAIFGTGGVLLALSLLIPTLAQCVGSKRFAAFASENDTPNEPPIRIYPAQPKSDTKTSPGKVSPGSGGPVPVMEEIAPVQPSTDTGTQEKKGADEMLIAGGDSP